jgi:hypothetical protein
MMELIAAEGSTLFFTSPFPVRELYAAKKSILGCLQPRTQALCVVLWLAWPLRGPRGSI